MDALTDTAKSGEALLRLVSGHSAVIDAPPPANDTSLYYLTELEPNAASRRAIVQSQMGELNTYRDLDEFRDHLRSL